MSTELWINLPVKDVHRSKEFFSELGFSFGSGQGDSNEMAELIIGDPPVGIMLFAESSFENFTRNKITDTRESSEVLFSIGAGSREEVDEMAKKVLEAGGTLFGEPGENQGWMYGCGFADLDGHRWNMLYMDMSKMTKA